MLKLSLIGASLVALTIVIQAAGTTAWLRRLGRKHPGGDGLWHPVTNVQVLISTGVFLVVLHVLQIYAWAATYVAVVPEGELQTFEKAMYFSFVTFTTLGYGDITLSEGWRILSGIQAMNGILLIGWSTAVLFAIVQRIYSSIGKRNAGD